MKAGFKSFYILKCFANSDANFDVNPKACISRNPGENYVELSEN